MKEMKMDKSIIFRKRLRMIICILFMLIISLLAWAGKDAYALYMKPQTYDKLKDKIIQKETKSDELDHAYIELSVDKITGSYAAYGGDEQSNQVYYLMPIENGTYFLTIIANREYIPIFDEMEMEFYNTIGQEDKTYKDPVLLEGGFKKIEDDEKSLALDYFTLYDASIQDVDQLSQYLSPYAFVIGEIGSISISTLSTLMFIWIAMILVCIICIIMYIGSYFHRKLEKDIEKLPEEKQEILNDDYEQGLERSYGRLGKEFLYINKSHNTDLYAYDPIIWVYKKEKMVKDTRHYYVYAYMKDGEEVLLLDSEVMKSAKTLLSDLQKQCPYALHGYQDFLYTVWKKQPKEFYEKLKSMNLLQVKSETNEKDSNN